ncbi:leucine zipper-EF-hand containing transmembrane protein 2 [Trypanosoma conorhini]|uniref:Leucine zipper-EF-hand containing transmembrane protein 2 n=1 Tax=Trypanosoma conorhini TaxID=83891 RepID=A0A3R7MAS3_9TRYP|nr:leucine zipper-EF-hand containing transmembrane protein 2 [Trypanosoma conorhini]RNF02505.1 leucine zipper-EF-hand containing transmembrane protein 2 [Trypanosoma conorhini]
MLRASRIRFSDVAYSKPAARSGVGYYANVAWEGLRHVYHGFRLFFLNTRLAWKYSRQLKAGVALTRRERLLLESATRDLVRLVPFSFFIVVPFAELLLPVALKMFPDLIPSTFETKSQGRNRAFSAALGTLRARQRVMEYLSTTAFVSFTKEQQEVVRSCALGESVSASQIKLIAPHFDRDGPLSVYKCPDSVALGLARTVGVFKTYHGFFPAKIMAPYMRRKIIRHYHNTREDDRFLRLEGLDDLTDEELIKANLVRGMRWTEDAETLRIQLEWWVSLSRDSEVPYNTLFWVKPTRYSLKESMKRLPLEQRQQLFGIQYLPEAVRGNLETLCETVDTVPNLGDDLSDADRIVEKLEDLNAKTKSSDRDISFHDTQVSIGEYLTEANVKMMFERIRKGKTANESVTVSDVIDFIGTETHNSSHIVSTVFDAFDQGQGTKPITEATLVSIGARCRGASKSSTHDAPKKIPTPSSSSDEVNEK